jgi:hypothetical protein
MRFVSAKQLIFPFGIKRLPPAPGLADAGVPGAVEELAQQRKLVGFVGPAMHFQEVGNKPRQALVLLGGFDARPPSKVFRQRDGDVLHDTDIVFSCSRVKPGNRADHF